MALNGNVVIVKRNIMIKIQSCIEKEEILLVFLFIWKFIKGKDIYLIVFSSLLNYSFIFSQNQHA